MHNVFFMWCVVRRMNVFAAAQVNDQMQVLDKAGGQVVPGLWCIGDANGKMMLAHAASAQAPILCIYII